MNPAIAPPVSAGVIFTCANQIMNRADMKKKSLRASIFQALLDLIIPRWRSSKKTKQSIDKTIAGIRKNDPKDIAINQLSPR